MFITFRNTDEYCKIILTCENRSYTLAPKGEVAVPFFNGEVSFTAEMLLPDFSDEIQIDRSKDKVPAKAMKRLAKKLVDKFPSMVLLTTVTYELTDTADDCNVFFCDGTYSVCDGYVADFFDMMPVGFCFARAETDKGTLRVTDVKAVNRKQYLKMQRNFNLFMDWGMILPDFFLFIPKYLIIRFYYTADFYVSKTLKGLYILDPAQRIEHICRKEKKREKVESGFGCMKPILWGVILFALLIGVGLWASSGEPDVVMKEDFSEVVCFDEVFVRIDAGLPADAKETFLEDYSVDYLGPDGEYDMFNYECHIYEDTAGNRYMWVKTDCKNPGSKYKDYEDYENPLVYKAVEDASE